MEICPNIFQTKQQQPRGSCNCSQLNTVPMLFPDRISHLVVQYSSSFNTALLNLLQNKHPFISRFFKIRAYSTLQEILQNQSPFETYFFKELNHSLSESPPPPNLFPNPTLYHLTEERLVGSGLVAEVRWQHCMEVRVNQVLLPNGGAAGGH